MTDDNREALREASVEKALQDYTNDIMDCSAGYNILRYARQGLLTYKEQEVQHES
jgi:hypothetical protein